MTIPRIAKDLLVACVSLAVVALTLCLAGHGPALAQKKKDTAPDKEKKDDAPPPKEKKDLPRFMGASSCMDCHTYPAGGRQEDFVLLTEFTTWRTQDKHSLAYLVLKGPRGQRMGELLKADVTKAETGCLNCHAMGNIKEDRQALTFDARDGVSCDACHGPAEQWLGPHTDALRWRFLSGDEKAALGMNNLRDPAVRAKVCMSCHVGDAEEGKVVTHAMYAAGHPPLPNFELATMSRKLPQHWRNERDVPFLANPPAKLGNKEVNAAEIRKLYHMDAADYRQTQVTMAGSVECLKQNFKLTAERAGFGKANGGTLSQFWPEVATFNDNDVAALWPQVMMGNADCYACHHELTRSATGAANWRQRRGYTGPPGRPQVRPWPNALARQGLSLTDLGGPLGKHLADVHAACNKTPFGDPALLAAAAAAGRKWLDGTDELKGLQGVKPDRKEHLLKLCDLPDYLDYDSARQVACAVAVIYNEWSPKGANDAEIKKLLGEFAEQFDLPIFGYRPDSARTARLQLIKDVFEKSEGRKLLTDEKAVKALEELSDQPYRENFVTTKIDTRLKLGRQLEEFLSAVRNRAGKDFTDTLLKGDFLTQLHAINEKELAEAMDRVAAYDPQTFKKRIAALKALLAKE